MRLAALQIKKASLDEAAVKNALLAHLCRCTGWRTILDAALQVAYTQGTGGAEPRSLVEAAERATIEGGSSQLVGPEVALGAGGFADDTAPSGALVAVPDGRGGFCVAGSLAEARAKAGKVQGRNTTVALRHPVELPIGHWAITLRTTFVEPAYLEPDASWCEPRGEPATSLANGGAFGGKLESPAPSAARALSDARGCPVRVVLSREDVVRLGPKRPPIAAALREDGSGLIRVGRTPGSAGLSRWADAVRSVLTKVDVEEVEVAGPPVSADVRGAGWAEASVLALGLEARRHGWKGTGHPLTVTSPGGSRATATIGADGTVSVRLFAGKVLDAVVLRSYAVGAVHQALGWVLSEGVAVSEDGEVLDLTIRSFGIITAKDMPPVIVQIDEANADAPAVRGGDAVFAAVAAAAWLAGGLEPAWPLERVSRSGSSRTDASTPVPGTSGSRLAALPLRREHLDPDPEPLSPAPGTSTKGAVS